MPLDTPTAQAGPGSLASTSWKIQRRIILWSLICVIGLAIALLLVTRDGPILHVGKLGDLKSHEPQIESVHLIAVSAGRFVVVKMKQTQNRALALLRPGQKLYVFAEDGNLTKTVGNDVDDVEAHFDLEETPSSRLLSRELLDEMLAASPTTLESICSKIELPKSPAIFPYERVN
jgi:hypothetical protein